MDSNETLKTLCNTIEKYEGYSVFEVDFNSTKIKMMALKDVKCIVDILEKLYPKEAKDQNLSLSCPCECHKSIYPQEYHAMNDKKCCENHGRSESGHK